MSQKKHAKKKPSRKGYAVIFLCSDHQSNTKNISIKFYKEMLNRFQEKEKRKKKNKKKRKKKRTKKPPNVPLLCGERQV